MVQLGPGLDHAVVRVRARKAIEEIGLLGLVG